MKYKISLLTLLLFSLISSVKAAVVEITNPRFDLLSTQDGLSQKTVQVVFQDSYGFLWFGTQEGLNKYDGQKVTVFRHSPGDPKSISNDVIRDVTQDSKGNIWIATSGGLNRYVSEENSFERIELLDEKNNPVQRLNAIYVDQKGNIWVGTDGSGIFESVMGDSNPLFKQSEVFRELNTQDIRAIFEDSRNRLWIGTDGGGLVILNTNDNSLTNYLFNEEDPYSISHNRIRSITEDSKGSIWVGTRGGGANRYDELTKKFTRFRNTPKDTQSISHNRVYKIFEDDQQNLWFATDGGISIFRKETQSFKRIQNIPSMHSSLSHNRVLSIFQDSSGILWFGTLSGVNKWNPLSAAFINYRHVPEISNGLSFNHIHALAEDNTGKIFIATFGGGLDIYDSDKGTFKNINSDSGVISDDHLISLSTDKENNLWIGTLSRGVEVLDEKLNLVKSYRHQADDGSSLSDNAVTSILHDKNGELWISTYRAGLNRLDNQTEQFKRYNLKENTGGLLSENLYQVIEDDEGYIWLATDGGGISRLDKNTGEIKSFAHDPDNSKSLSGNIALSIYQDSKGRFWIGTQGNGLERWEPGDRRKGISNFIHYNAEKGLNSSTVNGVIEDENGFIWISTVEGVSKLNPDTDEIIHFNLADEIHKNELGPRVILKSKDGRLYFGGLDGISAFYPDKVKLNSYVPPVILTQVLSENKPLLFEESVHNLSEITFDHNDYLISFEFASLDFSNPKKNQYQYKLEGFDGEWINSDSLNRGTFTNLPSGTYTLKVKGSNNDGVWSKESVNLKVNVLPAPWFSWWAYSLYGIVFCIIIILMIRSQAKRIANQEMFQAQVSDKVSEKTELYLKNNNFLKEQLESVKNISNVDVETGLPNQKYFSDLVAANVGWVKRVQLDSKDTSWRMALGFIRIQSKQNKENFERDFNRVAKAFAQDNIKYEQRKIIRWGSREIGVLDYFNNEDSDFDIDEWKNMVATAAEQNGIENINISIAYCVSPLGGIKDNFLNGNDMMMLTEHLLHLVEIEHGHNVVGLEKLNQPLNNVIFKQILEADRLSELSEVFTLKLE